MCYLHENNVMHRDVRGSNIVLTRDGEVKLVDFGLSRMVQNEMGKRYTCVGSPCWMAPEVAMSKSNSAEGYGNRADVWAIGITAIDRIGRWETTLSGYAPYKSPLPNRSQPSSTFIQTIELVAKF